MTKSILTFVSALTLGFTMGWAALGAEATTTPGEKQLHSMLCVDAESAALVGQAIDDDPDRAVEALQGMIRHHKCIFVPGGLEPVVTMVAKVKHVAATDVWSVTWDNETWFVPLDAPRDPEL